MYRAIAANSGPTPSADSNSTMANDDVKGLSIEQFRQLASVRVAKGNLRCHPAGFRLLACNPEHLFGTIKQHDLIAHTRELNTRKASATAHIESSPLRCLAGQEASHVLPCQLGTQPASSRLQVCSVFVRVLEPRSIKPPHLKLHGTAEHAISHTHKLTGS